MPAKKHTKAKAKPKKKAKKSRGRAAAGRNASRSASRSGQVSAGNRDTARVAAELDAEDRQGRSAGQAGSLEDLSDVEEADAESVDELLEEGNAFEAGIVSGVQNARDPDQQELRTKEFPEDDVPEEYENPEE